MPDSSPRSESPTREGILLAVDSERAQALLHSIAVELASSALGATAALHVRALALKREVSCWTERDPSEAQRSTTIDELLELHERIKAERGKR